MTYHIPFIDGGLSQSNRVTASWLNGVNNAVYGNGDAAAGSALIQFIGSGTGAGVRDVQTRMREIVDIRDYYADGVSGNFVDPTGTIFSSSGIQRAINAASAIGAPVFASPGRYKMQDPLQFKDYQELFGAGPYQTKFFGTLGNASYFQSQYGENPTIGQRPTGIYLSGFSIDNASIVSGSVGINFRNSQYGKVSDVFMTQLDTGIVTDQITQYCNFENNTVQVANYGASFASIGGGNRIIACDFGANIIPVAFNGGAWDVTGITAEALLTTTTYCIRVGLPGGQSTLVQATSVYVEGTNAGIISIQFENSCTQTAFRMHRHSTLGTIVNNAGENVLIEVPGQGFYTPIYKAQRIAFSNAIDGTELSSMVSEGGNTVAFRNAARTGYAHTYQESMILSGPAFGQASAVNFGNGTASTVGAAGGASALPATPLGYWKGYVGNTPVKVPYYPD